MPRAGRKRGPIQSELERLVEIAATTEDEVLRSSAARQALALSRRARVKIPRRHSILLCKRCGQPLRLSTGARIRARGGRSRKLVVRCGACGGYRRFPY